jgi:hypothetical protein
MNNGIKVTHYPIQFSIPTNRILNESVEKEHCFSYISPGKTKYSFDSEDEYYRHYASCYFAVTMEKGGWDCLRHYEILGSGCVPYFLDLENCPKDTMFRLPKKLLMKARELPGMPSYEEVVNHAERDDLENLSFDWDKFDKDEYFELLDELKSYTRNHLTTEAMAKYFMDKLPYDLERVLVVCKPACAGVDYQRDLLVVGLTELGVKVHMTSDLWWLREDLHRKQRRKIRRNFWGKGFTTTGNISTERHLKLLEDHNDEMFDAIIMSTSSNTGYCEEWERYTLEYSAERIVWVDGNDISGDHKIPPMCGITFRREVE